MFSFHDSITISTSIYRKNTVLKSQENYHLKHAQITNLNIFCFNSFTFLHWCARTQMRRSFCVRAPILLEDAATRSTWNSFSENLGSPTQPVDSSVWSSLRFHSFFISLCQVRNNRKSPSNKLSTLWFSFFFFYISF